MYTIPCCFSENLISQRVEVVALYSVGSDNFNSALIRVVLPEDVLPITKILLHVVCTFLELLCLLSGVAYASN